MDAHDERPAQEARQVKFMLMMNVSRGTGDWNIFGWPKQAIEGHMAHMHALNADLRESGEFVGGEGLTPPAEARIVRASADGQPQVTDGPFVETKEFLAGYWIVECASPERAYQIAARASSAPGPDGRALNMAIEVRQVYSTPPVTADV
jgi:hypothetical protein